MDAIQSAIAKKEILDSLRPIDPEHEQRIMQKFRLDWNYHSNHIEGNSLSYGETKALLLFNITAHGKPLKDHFEIKGHNEAIDWVLDVIKNKENLTEHFIRQLHEVLLKEPYISDAMTPDGKPTKKKIEVGKYKTHPNHVRTVTGEIFHFASPEETPAKMHDLLDWYNDKKDKPETNPLLLAAEFHYRFVRIHPFEDGNGRMARMLMNFILMQYGYPPVIIKSEDKQNYIRVLEQADTVSITPFIEYIALNLDHSLDIMIAGAQGESIDEPDDIDKEMMLLEQEISNTNKKIEKYRSEEVTKEVIKSIGSHVLELFKKSMSKIRPYYKQQTLISYINDNLHLAFSEIPVKDNIIEAIITNKSINWSTISSIAFKVRFNDLLPIPNESRSIKIENFENIVALEFFATYYRLSNTSNEHIIKLYNEKFSDDEIYRITKGEALKHLKYIAQKKREFE